MSPTVPGFQEDNVRHPPPFVKSCLKIMAVGAALAACGGGSSTDFSPAESTDFTPTDTATPAANQYSIDRRPTAGNPTADGLPENVQETVDVDAIRDVGTGSVLAEWTSEIVQGETGVVKIEIRALEQLPSEERLDEMQYVGDLEDDDIDRLAVPIYVRPGEVVVEVIALDGLAVLGGPTERRFNVQPGIVATRSWSIEAVRPGRSAVRIVARQVAAADPDVPISSADLQRLPIDEMDLQLRLTIKTASRAAVATDADAGTGSTAWGVIVAVASAAGISVVFLMWLASQALERRQRCPRIAAALGYLPHRLAEFKNLKGTRSSER